MTTAFNPVGETDSNATLEPAREDTIGDPEGSRWSRVWSHRPQFLHLTFFFAIYVLGCGFAQALAIVPGITVSIWPPGGIFIATLILTSRYSWPWWILAGCLAEMFAQLVWFHSPPAAGFLIFVGNALCATFGATLVNRICGRPVRLESLAEVVTFVVAGAGVAPLASATWGSATLAWFGVESQTFTSVWPLFWIGDATGILLVAPPTLVAIQYWRGKIMLPTAQWTEAAILGLVFVGVAAFSLSAHDLQSPYIIMPPLLWLAVRFEFRGAAIALTLLVLITMALTMTGDSQFVGGAETQRQRQVALQLFLVISAFSALIVAAISRQHQQALITLRQSERQLQQMIDVLPVRIWSATPAGEPLYFNKRYQDHFSAVMPNFKSVQAVGIERLVNELTHPEDAPRVQRTLRSCFENGSASMMRFRWREKDGAYRWAECRVEPRRDESGAVVEWYGVSLDVDDEVRAQQTLHERERELSLLVNMVPIHVWRLMPSGEPSFYNKRLTDFLGLDVMDVGQPGMNRLATTIQTLIHPDDAAGMREALNHSIATGEHFSMRYRLRRADGLYRWFDSRAEPLLDHSGTILQWYGANVDVDDEVCLYKAIEEREAKIRRLVDSDIIGIVIWDLDGRLIDANDAFLRMIQYDREELRAGLRWFDMSPPEWREVHAREEAEELRATGKMEAREKEYFRKDGSRVPVLIGAACFEGQSRQGVAYILDLTERKHADAARMHAEDALRRASDELAKATQAASLAELSASIAHEVNQPLAAVVANSHACQRWLNAEPPNLERAQITVERIIRDANAAADVVSRIRALFRRFVEPRSSTGLDSVIAEARNLIAEEATRRRVRIDLDVQSDLPLIALDRIQIQQVLVNLMRNGLEAMDAVADERSLSVRARRVGDSVQIDVSDSGPGVEFPDRMFEPFFTTKEQGMGMGLAISRSIVESHGGRLWVEKSEPRGATFIFTLPVEAKATA